MKNIFRDEFNAIKETRKDLIKFGYSVGTAFLVISIILFFAESFLYYYLGSVAIILIFMAYTFPTGLRPVNRIWMKGAIVLSWFMTRLILIILFYIIVTPIGWIARLAKKDFMPLDFDRDAETYWEKRERKKVERSDYERQF